MPINFHDEKITTVPLSTIRGISLPDLWHFFIYPYPFDHLNR
ncbi:hypothetical protein [Alicyclobacillus sp. ALC3]|nr:hypothetical protein [Alicyclobacillus sp. ALC3]